MLPEIVEEDSDLPEPLNTSAKQEKRAKLLAAAHTGKKALRVQAPGIQGFFSRTRIVKLVDGEKVVIQFRIQPFEIECFTKARARLGDVVPDVTQIRDEELESLAITTYAMTYLPGQCWAHIPASQTQKRLKSAESLGTILARGRVEDQSSAEVVGNFIVPTLKRLRDCITEATESLRSLVENMIAAAPRLGKLPLYVSHWDLNEANVLVDDDGAVSGIVDWECARDLPFGMGLHRVTDTIVAENCQGKIEIPPGSAGAEKAFWNAVLADAPKVVTENLDDVQTALHIGALIFAFLEKHLDPNEAPSDFLMGILSYRLPQLRGDEGPFATKYLS